jgi:hypothetical protein
MGKRKWFAAGTALSLSLAAGVITWSPGAEPKPLTYIGFDETGRFGSPEEPSQTRQVELWVEHDGDTIESFFSRASGAGASWEERSWSRRDRDTIKRRTGPGCAIVTETAPPMFGTVTELMADIFGPTIRPDHAVIRSVTSWEISRGLVTLRVEQLGPGQLNRRVSNLSADGSTGTIISDGVMERVTATVTWSDRCPGQVTAARETRPPSG